MAVVSWPSGLAPIRNSLRPINQARSANRSLSGFVQVTDGLTGRWAYRLEFNTLKEDQILPYRALLSKLRGRANRVQVPIFDSQLFPTDAEITATISGTAGDTEADVDLSTVSAPETKLFAGHYFNAGDDLHIIEDISWVSSTATITFWPALRSDKSGADFLLRPTLTCRLMFDDSGEHMTELGLKMAPIMELEEALDTSS